MQKQKLKQVQGAKLSPQQIQFLSLLQIPLSSLDSRIQDELEENPALEEIEDDDVDPDELYKESFSSYKYRDNHFKDFTDHQISDSQESLQEHLKKQISVLNIKDDEKFLIEYLIDSLDEQGWLNREFFSISDDLLVNLNLEFSEEEIEKALLVIQSLEPYGVGARNLRECLLIQLKNKDHDRIIDLAIKILKNEYNSFSKKNYEALIKNLNISKSDLKQVYLAIERLNPFPASHFTNSATGAYISPDFIVTIKDEKNEVSLTKRSGKDIQVSSQYQKMMSQTIDKEAKEFLKQKIESANWFKKAILQREETLLKVMSSIVLIQDEYFKSGDEGKIKAMKLADIAEKVGMDISTISRVTNSKYVQTFFGIFLLKDLFSEAYSKENGEVISTKSIKQRLKEIIEQEDKTRPFTDESLCEILGRDEYHIARRTVAKYRESLGIETSRYRREL